MLQPPLSFDDSPHRCDKQRVALVIQYLGTHFHGWQRQIRLRTVQEEIEAAIASVTHRALSIHGAGRTDTGVHAAAQVAHFDAPGPIPAQRWAAVLNSRLPQDILIRDSAPVAANWHAQFSALWRRYRYTIYTDKRPNLFIKPYSWHYYRATLDESRMAAALESLLGKHDLSAFRRAGSARAHSFIEVQAAQCDRRGPFLVIEIQADGFLYGMVRLLVGMLVEVGAKQRSVENFVQLWQHQQREEVKYAAPARGLCLLRVGYADFPIAPQVWYDAQPMFLLNG
ncbi:MAG: tRNA pseudouridine(38-40) synthase TruA [Chloroflexaceae bacterium]|nr:tRNA pseudouridine(38-40) synthase TruA [Chloroflexaceae bacterium]